jgi:small-conductance mechanosensitive channel
MTRLAGFDIAAPPALVLPAFVAILLVISALVARIVSGLAARWLRARAAGPNAEPGEPPHLGIGVAGAVLVGGLLLVIPELPIPERFGRWVWATLVVALVFACGLVVSRLAVAAVTAYAARNPSLSPAVGVARVAVRLAIAVLAIITALQALGVPVAPLLTTLGVGSLAVALALQETLANFFAGLYLLADRPVRTGDYIKIHDGEEGYVEAIGWRSSRLRTQQQNVVIVPNQKLSQAILTNFHLPSPPVTLTIPVRVSYDADPDKVERVLAEELDRATKDIPEVHDAPTSARMVELADSGILWHCVVQVRDIEAQALAGHEIRRRILARLRAEKIEIPYPQRVVHTA